MPNRLTALMQKFQRGNRPLFHTGPFLPLARIREQNLRFNDVFRQTETMTAAALMSFELGFESTVVPFDMNVEAEILGAEVRYHDAVDGHPVYPTIEKRPVSDAGDVGLPGDIGACGRLPAILETITAVKSAHGTRGAVGVFMPGPFTLAGQVLQPEKLFVMLLKNPDQAHAILSRLLEVIMALREEYVKIGADFVVVEEGGGAGLSPKLFQSTLLPHLQMIFAEKQIPHIISLIGCGDKFVPFMRACDPDGINLDRTCDVAKARREIPVRIPLFSSCGPHDMLARATPAQIATRVHRRLAAGATTVGPPADIYPPAKPENITAFVEAVRMYNE
jgi:[methyl-Co(III) methanol/glycine betaine-specific corrinoid protein]:coenzyme M methyltransferase